MNTNVVVDVSELHKAFGAKRVLRGASLQVSQKDRVALIGSNGAGKSTLLRCLPRVVVPDSGKLVLFGEDVLSARGSRLRSIRNKIAFVFQKHNLVPRLSALTNVIHGSLATSHSLDVRSWYQALSSSATRKKAMHCLERVGLPEVAEKRVDNLSGGQSQRVAVARALMQEPQLLLADEPVASLDPVAAIEVMELFYSLTEEHGITLLFTTHHPEHAIKYSDRIVGLKEGTVCFDREAKSCTPGLLEEFYGERKTAA